MTSIWVRPRGAAVLHDTESLRELDYTATVDDGDVGVSFDPDSNDAVVFYANSFGEIADGLERVVIRLRTREARTCREPTAADRLAAALAKAEQTAADHPSDAESEALRDALELALTRWPEIVEAVAL